MKESRLDSGWFVRTIPRRPVNLLWEITDACNLRCLHCEAAAGRRLPDELTPEAAIELCEQIIDMGWRRVHLTGGEPTLRPDWPDIAARLSRGGCRVALITNGLNFDRELAAQARQAGVFSIAVSLDGLRETHDRIRPLPGERQEPSRFDKALHALETAVEAGMTATAITHINRWNFPELDEIHRLLGERGVHGWQVQLGVPLGRLREIDEPYMIPVEWLPELEASLAAKIEAGNSVALAVMHSIGYYGKHEATLRRSGRSKPRFFVGCVGGWRGLSICSDGLVKPCAIMPREFAVGRVPQERLADIWEDTDRFVHQVQWDETLLEGDCVQCQYRHLCRAGCTAMAYALTGSIYHNPYCLYAQAKRAERP